MDFIYGEIKPVNRAGFENEDLTAGMSKDCVVMRYRREFLKPS